MSGPKYSRAYIREMQRLKKLEMQLEKEIEERKRTQILANISNLEKCRTLLCTDKLLQEYDAFMPEAEELIPSSETYIRAKRKLEFVKKAVSWKCDVVGNSDKLLKEFLEYERKVNSLKSALYELGELRTILAFEGTQALREKNTAIFMQTEWANIENDIDVIPDDLRKMYYEVLDLMSENDSYEAEKKIIDETIMNVGDVEYRKRQLSLRKNAILVERNQSENRSITIELANELRGLYKLLGCEEKEIPFDVMLLRERITDARNELMQEKISTYIAESVQSVLEKRGYSLIDNCSIINKNNSIEKFLFEYGEDSLINMATSKDGQILFEVVGNGTQVEMDASRALKLEAEMRRFCPDYHEIKDILRTEYGIYLENERLYGADKKYAKAVDVSKKATERRQNKEKKMMYYDQ